MRIERAIHILREEDPDLDFLHLAEVTVREYVAEHGIEAFRARRKEVLLHRVTYVVPRNQIMPRRQTKFVRPGFTETSPSWRWAAKHIPR
ncbi:hypothetical protein IIK97_004078 [Salmonella enterica subsp. enterica serovar Nigeria]|nr:hypothetical protein [Salmonella enterica subsp. enterica serovar Nigeria]